MRLPLLEQHYPDCHDNKMHAGGYVFLSYAAGCRYFSWVFFPRD